MSHLPPNAIFSPSVARAAASAAKDWNYVDSWLHAKFHPRSPPSFERNADTLRALLALALANESADEERQLIASLEHAALQSLQQQRSPIYVSDQSEGHLAVGDGVAASAREAILSAIESNLSRDGTTALDAIVTAAAECGMALPTPEDLGRRMVSLAGTLSELEQMESRVQVVMRYIESEADRIRKLTEDLGGDHGYRPAADLAKQNLEAQRKIKGLSARLPELREKVEALASSVRLPSPTIEQIQQEEEAYLKLLGQKNALDTQIQAFQGLPHDTEQARQELESLRDELRHITQRRDAIFEGLVERETPRKPMRRP